MDITDAIALLALIVASYSAVLSTCIAINEFFRLKLSIIDPKKTYITLTKTNNYINEYGDIVYSYDKNLYTLIILVRLVNKSKNPTTINDIILNNNYILDSSSKINDSIPINFTYKSNVPYSCNTQALDYPILQPLITLKPLATLEGYLVFNNVKELPSKFDIRINTVQKSKTFHLKFRIANDYRNEHIQEWI